MKRVVVIGSKPDAVIPDGDVIYCANVSIIYYADQVARFRQIVNIITPNAIDDQKLPSSSAGQNCLTSQWEIMLTVKQVRLIILLSGSADRMVTGLRNAGYTTPITMISHQERRKLVERVSGCDDPILTADFFRLPVKQKLRYAGSAASVMLKRIFDQSKTCRSFFRPSTGIVSLLYAIDQHGVDCEYVIAGIGLNKRSVYSHTISSATCSDKASIPAHVFADRKILQTISSRYRISTTEQELLPLLPRYHSG